MLNHLTENIIERYLLYPESLTLEEKLRDPHPIEYGLTNRIVKCPLPSRERRFQLSNLFARVRVG
ncbi:MAG: hypothetical protein ACHQQQ_09785 [Bacteroidota bacterium]